MYNPAKIALFCLLFLVAFPGSIFGEIQISVSGPYSARVIAEKNYTGITLNILTHVCPNIGEPIDIHAREFEQLTGAKIDVTHVPWRQMFSEIMFGISTGEYDIVTPCSDRIPEIAAYVAPLPEKLLQSAQWQDILPYHKKIATYAGKIVQMTIDGDRHAMHYRYDVLQNPTIRAEYHKKFSKELTLPTTWKELNKLAAFLNGRVIDGKKMFGIVEITKKDDLLYSNFIKRVTSYAKHPEIKGGFYFDLKTMEPLINTPGWVEALRDFIAARQYYPPGGDNFGLVDVNASFAAGDAIFTDNWDDSFISAMEKTSPGYNNVYVTLSPGSEKVWNRKTSQWDHFHPANRVPFISMGWIAAVSAKSKNIDVAFDFLAYMSNPLNHRRDMLIGRFGINPFRKSDLDESFWIEQAGWKPEVARAYIDSLQVQMRAKTRVFDLRIPGNKDYMDTLQIAVSHALRGKISPQQALDIAAMQWKKITARYGIDSQRKYYADIVKMEDDESNN